MLQVYGAANDVPVLLLKPDDLAISFPSDSADLAFLKHICFDGLARSIAGKIGSQIHGLISPSDAKLFNEAIIRGDRDPDLIQKALNILKPLGKSASTIDFDRFAPLGYTQTTSSISQALRSHFAKRGTKIFYLLVDDTDQIVAPNELWQLNRLWSFLLAARKLCEALPNLRTILSLRSEVWGRLGSENAGQRDQLDHVRPLVRTLDPNENEMRSILRKRLEIAAGTAAYSSNEELTALFFDGTSVRLPTSEEYRSWPDFLLKSSRERPRDVVQLMGELAHTALLKKHALINSEVTEQVMWSFSSGRVDDLAVEYAKDCPQLKEIVAAFSGELFVLKAQAVKEILLKLPSYFGITLRGTRLHEGNQDHAFLLWAFLYEAGFLNARILDDRQAKEHRHTMYREDPTLVSRPRWHEMEKTDWEVHPAYRSFLVKKFRDEQSRIGATKRRPTK
jgi:hypothetical protein